MSGVLVGNNVFAFVVFTAQLSEWRYLLCFVARNGWDGVVYPMKETFDDLMMLQAMDGCC